MHQLKLVHAQHVWLAQGEGTEQHVVNILYERHATVGCVKSQAGWEQEGKQGGFHGQHVLDAGRDAVPKNLEGISFVPIPVLHEATNLESLVRVRMAL